MTLLDVENLWVKFPSRQGVFDAVRGISFTLGRERLGIVGESGSGKSMTGRAILRLIRPPGIVTADQISLESDDLMLKSERQMRAVRGQRISMVMQDPKFSLNPVMTIGQQIMEAYRLHNKARNLKLTVNLWKCLRQYRSVIRSGSCAPIRTKCQAEWVNVL